MAAYHGEKLQCPMCEADPMHRLKHYKYQTYGFGQVSLLKALCKRQSLSRHLKVQHGGVLQGQARLSVCSRCGASEDCGCDPSQIPLPDGQLLAQVILKMTKKSVKLGKDDR